MGPGPRLSRDPGIDIRAPRVSPATAILFEKNCLKSFTACHTIFGKPNFYDTGERVNTGPLSASLEDYLEAIYHIVHDKQAARAKDIAQRLGVNRSSVTGALHALSEKKLVHYTPYDIVTLTPEGERVAEGIAHRHDVLRDFFTRVLGVEETVAEENACRIEHAVSEDILDRLAAFIDFT